MKHKTLDYKKNYKVSGEILSLILNLQAMYENDAYGTEEFNRNKVDYTIGQMCCLFVNSEWEEV